MNSRMKRLQMMSQLLAEDELHAVLIEDDDARAREMCRLAEERAKLDKALAEAQESAS